MKIVVPVRQVAQLLDGFEVADEGGVDPDFMEFELNEWDSFSLAAAAELAKENAGSEVIAVTIGGDSSETVLRQAVSLGADRAVHIEDPQGHECDVLQVGRLIAHFAAQESAELVLCGVQSSDAGTGSTPSAVGGYLGWPRVTSVVGIDLAGDSLTLRRELQGGSTEHLTLSLPAVLAMQSGSFEVPYPTMKAKMAAKRKAIESVAITDLIAEEDGFEQYRGSVSLGFRTKTSRNAGVVIEGKPADVALAIRKIIEEELA